MNSEGREGRLALGFRPRSSYFVLLTAVFLHWTDISIIQSYPGSEQDLWNILNIYTTER